MRPVFDRLLASAGRALLCVIALCLAGCDGTPFDPSSQIGANPNLPEPRQ
jgi:hypothetical protein